uniref:Uncharacterized protein n=1 Tax=Steinernema glaseri TaxID=37863 RepID=A0A1I7Y1I1_9BILA
MDAKALPGNRAASAAIDSRRSSRRNCGGDNKRRERNRGLGRRSLHVCCSHAGSKDPSTHAGGIFENVGSSILTSELRGCSVLNSTVLIVLYVRKQGCADHPNS